MSRIPGACAVVVALALGTSGLHAQSTRTEELERQRAEKSTQLIPNEPGRLERALLYVEREDPLTKLNPVNGFFVRYGYTDRPTGAGIGFGGGYRHELFNRAARVELEGGITFKNYDLVRADFSFPALADDRVELGIETSWRREPQEDFYGPGADSSEEERVSYLFKGPRGADGTLTFSNAAEDVGVGPAAEHFTIQWSHVDNSSGARTAIGAEQTFTERRVQAPAAVISGQTDFVAAELRAFHPDQPRWSQPLTIYFKRTPGGFTLVGLERG